jgi:hypothetical protein
MGGGGFGALPFLIFSSVYKLTYLIGGRGIELTLPSADAISTLQCKNHMSQLQLASKVHEAQNSNQ